MIAALRSLFGLGETGGGGRSDYVPTPVRAMREITAVESFAAILPYAAWNASERVFILDTGERDKKSHRDAAAFCIEVSPQTGATQEMAEILVQMFSMLPPGTTMQVSMFASSDVASRLRNAALLRPGDHGADSERRAANIFRVLQRRRTGFYLWGSRNRLLSHIPCLIRDYRCVVSVVHPCDVRSPQALEALTALRDGVTSTLKSANLGCREWEPDDLINWCDQLCNPNKHHADPARPRKRYDDGRLIRHQIVDHDTICRPSDDGASLQYGLPGTKGEVHTRLLMVREYPKQFPLWGMGNLIGDFYQTQLGIDCPFLITMGVTALDPATHKPAADLKAARATTNASSPMARFLPDLQDRKEDWQRVLAAYEKGHGEITMYHQVMVLAPPDRIGESEQAMRSLFRSRGFELVSDQYMQIPGLLGTLPGAYNSVLHNFYSRTGRLSRKVTENAANLAPVIAEWRGTQTPTVQLIGRRGQLMSLDLFDNSGGNYNFAIAAASGSGKSVLANEFVVSYLGTGAKVWVIDVGRSYEKTCKVLGGTYIEYSTDPDKLTVCINPFETVTEINDDMELVKPLICQMLAPSGGLGDYERALVEKAIQLAWATKRNEAIIDDVAAALACMETAGNDTASTLATQLFPFTSKGMYGRFFCGKTNIDMSNDFIVLELEELKSKKDLQSVVLFLLMYRITYEMYVLGRARRKICLIDEAWDLMDGGESGKFIESGYRRARKYRGAFGTATQSVEDYYRNPAARAALDNSDWLFLLKQKKESIEQLERGGKLRMDESLKRILFSVRTEKGQFSEVFITCPEGSGVGRLIVDPYALLLYSTAPEDWTAIEAYKSQGLSTSDAIDAVLKDRGLSERFS